MDEPAELVESILYVTGWTQSRLVHELRCVARALREPEPAGLQAVTVNRWKRGRQRPSGYYQRLLRLLHAAVCGERAAALAARDSEGDEMRRRQFIAYATALTGSVALDPEHLAAALRRRAAVDSRLVEDRTASIRAQARRWHLLKPGDLLPAVKDELRTVNELRIASQESRVRRQLTSLTSEAVALAGWLAWQCGNAEAAEAYQTFAGSLAAECRDQDARAFVLVLRSFACSPLFRPAVAERDQDRSLAMLDEAVELTKRSTSSFLRLFGLVRRAEELARAGDGAEAGRCLDRAQAALASAPGPHQGFFSYWSEDRLRGGRGTCAMLLRRPRETIALLSPMATSMPAELAGERSILLTDLAAAHAMLGEVDQASALLNRSLDLGADGHAERVGRVLAIRSAHLSRWSGTPAVRDLDDAVRSALAGLSASVRLE